MQNNFQLFHLDLLQSQEDTSINCMLITVVVLENISLLSVWLQIGTVCLQILTLRCPCNVFDV